MCIRDRLYPQRKSAACAAHARRRFEELSRGEHSASAVAAEAMQRWARIYRAEGAFGEMSHDERRQARQAVSRPLWDEFQMWLKLQRNQVLDGSKIAEAIDYSLNAWAALTQHLDDGAVAIDTDVFDKRFRYVPFAAGVAPRAGRRSFHPATKRRYSASACSSHARSWSRTVFRL